MKLTETDTGYTIFYKGEPKGEKREKDVTFVIHVDFTNKLE